MPSARLKMIEEQMRRFADLPPEVFFKEELLRHGLSLGQLAPPDGSYQRQSYFIFSFDRTPIREMEGQENRLAPEEIALAGGPYGLWRTIVSVRLNPASPYRLEPEGGGIALRLTRRIYRPCSGIATRPWWSAIPHSLPISPGLRVYDLAEEWRAMTGLPFVFAFWAVRADAASPDLIGPFQESAAFALDHLDEITRSESARTGLPESLVRTYLTENIDFSLGEKNLQGLQRFYALACELGLTNGTAPLEFIAGTKEW